MFLLMSVGVSVVMLENRLSFYGKAQVPKDLTTLQSGPSEGLIKLQQLREQLEQKHQQEQLTTYQKQENGYAVSYDAHSWRFDENENEVSFTLDTAVGHALVTIAPIQQSHASATNNLFLQTWADTVAQQYQSTNQLARQEFTTIDEKPAYRFLLTETYFGQKSPWEVWLTVAYGKSYQISVRYESVLDSQAYALDLLNSLTFFDPQNPVQVKGTSTSQTYQAAEIAELVRPSVVTIVRMQCITMQFPDSRTYVQPEYQFCASGKGTGMIIGSDGYIATAGHVIALYPEQALVEQVLISPHPFVTDSIKEISFAHSGVALSDSKAQELIEVTRANPTAFNSFLKALFELIEQKKLILRPDVSKLYVQLGKEVARVDPNRLNRTDIAQAINQDPSIVEAQPVSSDFSNRYTPDSVLRGTQPAGGDVGIIKLISVSDWQLPALPFSPTVPKPGIPLVIVGFPSLVEGSEKGNSLLDYQTAATTHSVTQGIVSAIKQDNSGKLLIQTDTSIERGNSGGPAFNTNGEIVGIVTFGAEGKLGNYNFLRSVSDLSQLFTKEQSVPEIGQTYSAWKDGLTFFWNGYYTKARRSFQKVKQAYPEHPTVDEYMLQAEGGIQKGTDKGLLFGFEKDVLLRVAIYGVVLLAGGAIAIKLLLLIRENFVRVVSSQGISYG